MWTKTFSVWFPPRFAFAIWTLLTFFRPCGISFDLQLVPEFIQTKLEQGGPPCRRPPSATLSTFWTSLKKPGLRFRGRAGKTCCRNPTPTKSRGHTTYMNDNKSLYAYASLCINTWPRAKVWILSVDAWCMHARLLHRKSTPKRDPSWTVYWIWFWSLLQAPCFERVNPLSLWSWDSMLKMTSCVSSILWFLSSAASKKSLRGQLKKYDHTNWPSMEPISKQR